MAAFDLLAEATVGSGNATNIVFTSAGSTNPWSDYRYLELVTSGKSSYTNAGAGEECCIQFNSDTSSSGTNYKQTCPYFYGSGSSHDQYVATSNTYTFMMFGHTNLHAQSDAEAFSNGRWLIYNHDRDNSDGNQYYPRILGWNMSPGTQGTDNGVITYCQGMWEQSAAVTTITYFPRYGTSPGWREHTTAALYGYKVSN